MYEIEEIYKQINNLLNVLKELLCWFFSCFLKIVKLTKSLKIYLWREMYYSQKVLMLICVNNKLNKKMFSIVAFVYNKENPLKFIKILSIIF